MRVIVNGANGKMGKITVEAVTEASDLELVAAIDQDDDLANAIKTHQANIVIDFTTPKSVYKNTEAIIQAGAHPVIGTSGLTPEEIKQLQHLCLEKQLGGIIAPNFSLGAILMMKYAADAAKYFDDAEIIEMHHPYKLDAPSGTAKKTAEMMAESGNIKSKNNHSDQARGEQYQGINIHSVRLSGLFAHQAVIFGGDGELLTIRHDGMDRTSIMPGVLLACRKVGELSELVYGLEKLI